MNNIKKMVTTTKKMGDFQKMTSCTWVGVVGCEFGGEFVFWFWGAVSLATSRSICSTILSTVEALVEVRLQAVSTSFKASSDEDSPRTALTTQAVAINDGFIRMNSVSEIIIG